MSLLDLIDRTEGGGDYSTLYGHSQRSGPFAGVDVSRMSIGDAIAFADPSGPYGQWVASRNNGTVATPMGRYQIVGSTLRRAAQAMGLPLDAPFNQQTQDAIASYLVEQRLAQGDNLSEDMAALRNEWHGFRNVSDAELAAAIQGFNTDPAIGNAFSGYGDPGAPAADPRIAGAFTPPPPTPYGAPTGNALAGLGPSSAAPVPLPGALGSLQGGNALADASTPATGQEGAPAPSYALPEGSVSPRNLPSIRDRLGAAALTQAFAARRRPRPLPALNPLI